MDPEGHSANATFRVLHTQVGSRSDSPSVDKRFPLEAGKWSVLSRDSCLHLRGKLLALPTTHGRLPGLASRPAERGTRGRINEVGCTVILAAALSVDADPIGSFRRCAGSTAALQNRAP